MIKYYIGNKTMYINKQGAHLTQEELDQLQKKAYEAGYRDRMAGYYDKWYRYNHSDNGAAYDKGVQAAIESGKAKNTSIIIESL